MELSENTAARGRILFATFLRLQDTSGNSYLIVQVDVLDEI